VGKQLSEADGADSHNLLPVLLAEQRERPVRDTILLQSLGPNDLAVRQGSWKYIPWLGSGGFLTKPRREKPEKGQPVGQLYNLDADPAEQHNLHDQQPEIVDRLSRLLTELRQSSRTRGE
jgi:arylsulfatase A-like enzyme